MNKNYSISKINLLSSKPSTAIRLLFMVLFFTMFSNIANAQTCNASSGTVFSNTSTMCVGGATEQFWSNGWAAGGSWSSSNTSILTAVKNTKDGNATVTAIASGTADVIYTVKQAGCPDKVSKKTITVGSVGAVSANQSICRGNSLTSNITVSSAIGTIQWKRADDAAFTNNVINIGTNSTTLTIAQVGVLTATKYFRAVVTGGTCGGETSAIVRVTVSPISSVGTISSNQTICSGTSPDDIAIISSVGTIQWQRADDATFTTNLTNIGTNARRLTSAQIGVLTGTKYFRAVVTSGSCAATTSGTVTVTVRPALNSNNLSYTYGSSGTVVAAGDEHSNLVISSPTGYFTSVNFASYGTPNGTSPNFTIGTCHSNTSQSVIEDYLLGRNSGTIPAENDVFGDPCIGTFKRLYVSASYAEPVCNGDVVTIKGSLPTGGDGAYTYLWQSSTVSATSGFSSAAGSNTGMNYTSGPITQTTWFRRIVTSCTSNSVSLVVMVKTNPVNIWSGTAWSTGAVPTIYDKIVFQGNYNVNADVNGCSCTVSGGKNVTIMTGRTMKIVNEVNVVTDVSGEGSLTFENNASLIQINEDPDINSGKIIYNRVSSVMINSDYTYWSSPVASQTLKKVSPNTNPNRFWSFNAATNNWVSENSANTMDKGKGYIIRGPEFFPAPTPISGAIKAPFEGVPHNGEFEINIPGIGTSNLIGNPYPSALDAESFLIENNKVLGTLYFWTHNTAIRVTDPDATNEGSGYYVYISDDYASYNLSGGVAATSALKINGIVPPSNKPSGKIASGQGFFASGIAAGKAKFNNGMRVGVGNIAGDNMQFFKTTKSSKNTNAIDKNRVWLNLTNDKGAFKQVLVGYITDATNGYDNAFDGVNNNGNQFVNFYSINEDKNLTIQGRALPFDENDVVPLGYSSTIQGSFSISIDEVDGSLTSENIYLEDKSNNSIHDLKKAAYTFDTEKGTFNERFVLRYTDRTLGSADFDLNDNSVIIAKDKSELKIISQTEIISQIAVFDLLGRKVFEKTAINSNEFQTSGIKLTNQVVLVKVTLANGKLISKKVMY
jgi:hypothetical protein